MWLIDPAVERTLIRMAVDPTTREAAIEVLFMARRWYCPPGLFDPRPLQGRDYGELHRWVEAASFWRGAPVA